MPPLTPESQIIRARNVTASEVGALLDKHPYASPRSIYDRLSDPVAWEMLRDPQSEAMYLGTFFESRIASYAAQKLGLRLRANRRTREHPHHRLCATSDYYVVGHRMLIECKLSSIMYGWSEDDLFPHIEWQARAQLAVTDRDVCIIAALVGSRFYSVQVVRDQFKERRMLNAVDEMMERLSQGNRPPEMETKVSKAKVGKS